MVEGHYFAYSQKSYFAFSQKNLFADMQLNTPNWIADMQLYLKCEKYYHIWK